MTETKIGPCQCCSTITRLFSGASRFGDETWACDECWRPDERPSEVIVREMRSEWPDHQ